MRLSRCSYHISRGDAPHVHSKQEQWVVPSSFGDDSSNVFACLHCLPDWPDLTSNASSSSSSSSSSPPSNSFLLHLLIHTPRTSHFRFTRHSNDEGFNPSIVLLFQFFSYITSIHYIPLHTKARSQPWLTIVFSSRGGRFLHLHRAKDHTLAIGLPHSVISLTFCRTSNLEGRAATINYLRSFLPPFLHNLSHSFIILYISFKLYISSILYISFIRYSSSYSTSPHSPRSPSFLKENGILPKYLPNSYFVHRASL